MKKDMELLDGFALAAMQALIQADHDRYVKPSGLAEVPDNGTLAGTAYAIADAMIINRASYLDKKSGDRIPPGQRPSARHLAGMHSKPKSGDEVLQNIVFAGDKTGS